MRGKVGKTLCKEAAEETLQAPCRMREPHEPVLCFLWQERRQSTLEVVGSSMQRLIDSVNFDDEESMSWFHRTLRKAGAQEGDTVRIIDMEFDFVE